MSRARAGARPQRRLAAFSGKETAGLALQFIGASRAWRPAILIARLIAPRFRGQAVSAAPLQAKTGRLRDLLRQRRFGADFPLCSRHRLGAGRG